MATDAHSQVTIDVAVNTATVAPKLDEVKQSLKGLNDAQREINDTASQIAKDVPRSMADVAAQAAAKNIWNLPVRDPAQTIVQDVAPAAEAVTEETGNLFQRLGDQVLQITGNIKQWFSGAFESLVPKIKEIGGKIATALSEWVAPGVGFGVGVGISALFDNAIKGMGELVDTVDKLAPVASNIGISIQELQRFNEWAKEGGVPVATVNRSMQDLTKTIGQINEGLGGPGVKAKIEAFGELGFLDEHGKVIFQNAAEAIPPLMDQLAQMEDPAKRAAYAATVLGTSWRGMLPLLEEGPEAFQKAVEASQRVGEITPNMEQAAKDWKAASTQFYGSLQTLRTELGGELIVALLPALQQLTTFVQDNRETLVWTFGEIAKAIGWVGEGAVNTMKTIHDFTSGDWMKGLQSLVKPQPTVPADFVGPMPDVKQWQSWKDAAYDVLSVDEFKKIGEAAGGGFIEGFKDGLKGALKASLNYIFDVDAFKALGAKMTGAAPPTTPMLPPGTIGTPTTTVAATTTTTSTSAGPSFGDLMGARTGTPTTSARPVDGQVKVTIENKSPQQSVAATAAGQGVSTQVNTGMSMPWSAPPGSYTSGPWAPGPAG
jgi:hypothetical protein